MSFLFSNLIRFGRLLHAAGADVPAGRMIDVASALEHIDIAHRADFYHALRGLLVHRRQDLPVFDELFRAFWRERQRLSHDLRAMGRQRSLGRPDVVLTGAAPREATDDSPPTDDVRAGQIAAASYSAQDALRAKDFAEFTDDELRDARRIIGAMRWDLGQRRTWRRKRHQGREADLRRLVRENIRYGWEPVRIPTRGRTTKPRPLVIIADVSGSMERYARMLLHFIYSVTGDSAGQPLQGRRRRVEAFVFATRFTRITGEIAKHGVRDAATVTRHVPDWGGGTRIGDAVRAFNVRWARRVVSRGAIVLLISDGWDRGDPEVLGSEMARLQRSCRRLIWLNPLLGAPGYQPLTRGMQAALRHIDDFLPAHNINSLEALAAHLGRLGRTRAGTGGRGAPSLPRRRES